MWLILAIETKNNQPGKLRRWVRSYISKAQIESDDGSPFFSTQGRQLYVLDSAYALIVYRHGIVASLGKQSCRLDGEVLVDLEFQASKL